MPRGAARSSDEVASARGEHREPESEHSALSKPASEPGKARKLHPDDATSAAMQRDEAEPIPDTSTGAAASSGRTYPLISAKTVFENWTACPSA
eukprot:206062-Amphidinium_carterae.1